ncbi:T9SS type A sorting domain-containing protein [Bacteroidota bacterium]
MRRYFIMMAGVLGIFSAIAAQDCSDLFISEYLEGSGNSKGLEIYNPTADVINLGSYYITRYSNGGSQYLDDYSTQLEGFIQPYSTHLIVNGQTTEIPIAGGTSPPSDPVLRSMAQQLDGDYPAPCYMNGNDAIALFKDPVGNGDVNDFQVLDLFGIIGGGMTTDDEGWASITDQWIYKNVYDDDKNIIGQDSTYVTNYIFPDGYYFLEWWLWSQDHALVRKPSVKHGVTIETMPTTAFDVTMEWDTVPGNVDVWDSLNAHYCDCEHSTAVDLKKVENRLTVYPNPAQDYVSVTSLIGLDDIQILDISGKTVRQIQALQGTREKKIKLDEIPQGVYIIRARSGDIITTRKLLIQ